MKTHNRTIKVDRSTQQLRTHVLADSHIIRS